MIVLFTLVILFFSIVIHEVAHGSVALQLGDPTAKNAGRLTLNPLSHIDLFGTIILPLFLIISYVFVGVQGPVIGWAKPVPINPYNFRDRKWGNLKVSIAGPGVNFLIALVFGLTLRFIGLSATLSMLFGMIVIYNILLGLFNLVPIPPLDGSHIFFTFLPERFSGLKTFLQQYGFFILLFFIFFGGLNVVYLGAQTIFSLVTGQALLI